MTIVELAIWAVAFLWEMNFIGSRGRPTVGLLAMCIAVFALSHCFGALIHQFPWADLYTSDEWTERGFSMTSIGLLALWMGAKVIAPAFNHIFQRNSVPRFRPPEFIDVYARRYVLVGLFLVGGLLPIAGDIPSATSLASSGLYVALTGVCLYAWKYSRDRTNKKVIVLLASLFVLPVITLALNENVIRAVAAIMLVLIYAARIYRPRWQSAAAILVIGYFGLSFGISYLLQRDELRNQLREEGVVGKFERSVSMFTAFKLLDPADQNQLQAVDARMNQNWLIGAAMDNFEDLNMPYLNGETLIMAAIALVPRAIWPEKPIQAGGMNLASVMTGFEFDENTSVGIGPVLEFYANFGFAGVVVGMLLLGALIGVLDLAGYRAVTENRFADFSLCVVAGLSLIRPEGSFVEMSVTFVANLVVALTVNKFITRSAGKSAEFAESGMQRKSTESYM